MTTAEPVVRGVRGFAEEMKEQGIHVGLGSRPHCVVDGEAWPCTHELVAGVMLGDVVDYGFGTFKGEPLVLCTMGGHFHRHDHNGTIGGVTFTESFAPEFYKRCRVCWPTHPQ